MNTSFKSFVLAAGLFFGGMTVAEDATVSTSTATVVAEQGCGICAKAGAKVVDLAKAPFRMVDNSVNFIANKLGVTGTVALAFVAGYFAQPVVDKVNELLEEDELLA